MSGFGDRALPTKINLIRLRNELKMLRRIRSILEEKRDVLILYVRQTAEEYQKAYAEAASRLIEAYKQLMSAIGSSGYPQLEALSRETPPSTLVDVRERALFAVKVPAIDLVEASVPPPPSAVVRAGPTLLEARQKLLEAFRALLKVVEVEYSLRSLLNELRTTQRQINTLDNVLIPRTVDSIKFISLVLDDRQREEVIRLKMIKRRLEKVRRQAGEGTGGLV
ncbi:MAG: V-type ATP synthase subunit D [Thermoproteota archaeon]